MTTLRAAAETHTGYVRAVNQDQAVVSGDLVAVADGMGGHRGGEVAARMAIDELVAAFVRDKSQAGLMNAVHRANRVIWRRSRVDRKLHGMGTTLTAAALVDGQVDGSGTGKTDGSAHVVLVNIGDSRAYKLGDDGRSIEQLTEDHTVVEEMVRHGELSAAEAAVHPRRHVLTKVLGVDPDAQPDQWDLELTEGTRLILCSDGLTNEVPEPEIAEVLGGEPDPAAAARELVGRALGHGGTDNVTVVVIDVAAGDPSDAPFLLVPPRPAEPDTGFDHGDDVTEAIPVASQGAEGGAAGAAEGAKGGGMAGPPEAGAAGAAAAGAAAAGAAAAGTAAALGADAASHDGGAEAVDDGGATKAMAPVAVGGRATFAGRGAAPKSARLGGNGVDTLLNVGEETPAAEAALSDGARYAPTQHQRAVVLVPERGMRRSLIERIVTFRVALFVLVLAALIAGAIGTVVWFNQASYYVGLSGQHVAIYQGRPGGLLWFKPQLIETSALTTQKVLPSTLSELRAGVSESSLQAARTLVADLATEHGLLYFAGEPPTSLAGTLPPPSTAATSTTQGSPSSTASNQTSTSLATTSTQPGSTTSTTKGPPG